MKVILSLGLLFAFLAATVHGCSNVLVTPGASVDGSAFLTYNADSGSLMGRMYFAKHATWPANSTVDVHDWDTGKYLGKIAQVSETYTVVGNMNEYQLAITETTFEGLEELRHQSKGIVDYGSLIYLTLQRAKTAREAIDVMGALVAKYGYYSEGESFSIADTKEVWIMEMIGKGEHELGAVWVARKIPDGYISSHANQARITTFPHNDPSSCVYSSDVVSFAKAHGLYPVHMPDSEFSFSDTYNPVSFLGARACEARVWSVFRHVAGTAPFDQYLSYVLGKNLTNRMPLWIRPAEKLTLNATMMLMRDHYEGSPLDFTTDVGAEAFGAPYRRSLLFDSNDGRKHYLLERAIAVIQTGFAIVTQSRGWLPREIGGIIWFGVDDAATTVYFPAYTSATRVPEAFVGGDIAECDFNKAWWVFNLVANFVYPRWSLVYPLVFEKIDSYESKYMAEVPIIDAQAKALYASQGAAAAVEHVTAYSESTGNKLVKDWFAFFGTVFGRFRDVYVTEKTATGHSIKAPGYTERWRSAIIADTGDRYLMPDDDYASNSIHQLPKQIPKFLL